MIKIIIICLIVLILTVFLRQIMPEYSLFITIISGIGILVFLAIEISTPFLKLFEILNNYGINKTLSQYLLKAFGICLLTKFSAELCIDFGQSSLSGKVEMAGKIAIFLLSFPLIEEILNTGLSLL